MVRRLEALVSSISARSARIVPRHLTSLVEVSLPALFVQLALFLCRFVVRDQSPDRGLELFIVDIVDIHSNEGGISVVEGSNYCLAGVPKSRPVPSSSPVLAGHLKAGRSGSPPYLWLERRPDVKPHSVYRQSYELGCHGKTGTPEFVLTLRIALANLAYSHKTSASNSEQSGRPALESHVYQDHAAADAILMAYYGLVTSISFVVRLAIL